MRPLRFFVSCTASAAIVVVGVVLLARRGGRWYRSQPLPQQVDIADACRPDRRGRETLGDYLQSLVDKHNLLRREY